MQMLPRGFIPSLLLALATSVACTALAQKPAPVIAIDGLGKGLAHLDQRWQFHIGDDPRWAEPDFDDATSHDGWESILTDRPWGAQGHYAYSGFAWYRLHISISPAAGFNNELKLVLPSLSDSCEVYWNGLLIGRYGTMPPHAFWPALNSPAIFILPPPYSGTLAVRVWKGPLGSSSSGEVGGLTETPLIGDDESVRAYIGDWNYGFLKGTLFNNALNVLYLLVGIAGTLLWLRRQNQPVLLWLSIFAVCPAIWNSFYTMRIPVSSQFAQLVTQPLWHLRNVALWFLLLDLLNLRRRAGLVRWAKILAIVCISSAFFDGCLTYVPLDWMAPNTGALIDWFLTIINLPCDLYLLVLAAFGFNQKHDSVRWVLAVSSSLSQLLAFISALAQQGQRFTHWTLTQTLNAPLFHIGPVYLNAQAVLDLLVFFSILYAVYRHLRDQQTRNAILEQELQSARELQQVLIPERPPDPSGYSISTAYHPALEVGGDFFQIIPLEGECAGSTLIILGDVSGKGLRAAMAVSLIVGAVRTLAEDTCSPAQILAGLSRRLFGRLQGGFTTCLAVRLDADGICTLASAGHPAPYVNDREIELPGALPLGIDPSVAYEEITMRLDDGDRYTLYTDGLLEARAASGEIFSFKRLQALMATVPDASAASAAAVAFGQEDDITVLTVKRST